MKSEAWILTPRELQTIRAYVKFKYAAAPERQPAVFADAIRQVLMRELPELGESLRHSVAANLIRTRVLGSQSLVRTEDIWRACLEELPDPGKEDIQVLLRWLQKCAKISLDESQLRELIANTGEGNGDKGWSAIVDAAMPLTSSAATERVERASVRVGWPARVPQLVYVLLCLLIVVGAASYGHGLTSSTQAVPSLPAVLKLREPLVYRYTPELPEGVVNELPADLRYLRVDEQRLRDYLGSRDSLLLDEPYYGTLIDTAWRYDIHPLLLFAITGQEQGFVPRDQPDATLIANNPFNVYHSWQIYNTTIADSADIAARTVLRWARERPPEYDVLVWVNRKYAEDPNWASGVSRLFDTMRSYGKPES